jgi:hypothetical protein
VRFLILLLLFVSCSVTGPLREDRPATGFSFPQPLKGWKVLPLSEGAQRLYQHVSTGSVLSVSSLCDRYATAPLSRLVRNPLAPLGALKEIESQKLTISDRDAEQLHVSGSLDGVKVEVVMVVLRKNECIFDFSLQASPQIQNSVKNEFLKMVKGFSF